MGDEMTELQGILDEFEHECYMLRVEASETRAKDDVVRKSYERIRDEFMERIAVMLGSKCEAELQGALNKAAGNWARADERAKALEDLVRDLMVRASSGMLKCQISCACCEFEKDDGCEFLIRAEELGVM